MIGDDFFKLTPIAEQQPAEELTNSLTIKEQPEKDSNRISHLVNRSLSIFKDKLIDSGYNSDEIEKILKSTEATIKKDLGKFDFCIIWTINLSKNESQRTKKTLVDTFKALHIDINPLGHYEMIIDYWSNGISVSEVKGHRPQLIQ